MTISQTAIAGYRYTLSRSWTFGSGLVVFIMLNPSTADDTVDDPTIRRCVRFAQSWGFARLEVVNLFAARATNPSALRDKPDPVGGLNDWYIWDCSRRAGQIVAAWGAMGGYLDRAAYVMKAILHNHELFCLGTTALGHPRHPLYVQASKQLEPFAINDHRLKVTR